MKAIITEEQKAQLLEEYGRVWGRDQRMIDFCMKRIQRAVTLSNGDLVVIEKPHIKTSFCFGHGWCGVSSEDDEERANKMAETASNDVRYFIKENTDGFSPFDREHSYSWKHLEPFAFVHYYGGKKLMGIRLMDAHSDKDEIERLHAYKLSDKDAADLRQIYEEERARHIKRLETYLKKFGLTKLNVWTYLVD